MNAYGPVHGWWVLSGRHLLDMLNRVAAGEDPGLVYAEEYANANHTEDAVGSPVIEAG